MEITAPNSLFPKEEFTSQPGDGVLMKTVRNCASYLGLGVTLSFAPGQQLQLQQRLGSASLLGNLASNLDTEPSLKAGDFLTQIKQGWQFNITELAEVLGVVRPTVYSWMNGKTSPNAEMFQRLQVIAAAARVWNAHTNIAEKGFLLDYMGPLADELSIRQCLASPKTTTDELRELIPARIAQSRKAREEVSVMLGDALPHPVTSPPAAAQRMNAAWAKNTKALHAARNRSL
jgi:transcriptional regulator with XRE-family HTH domain